MAHKAVEQVRAGIAFSVTMLMLRPGFNRHLIDADMRNENGNIPMLVAGPDESAVLTLHRIEAMHVHRMLLATEKDGVFRMTSFTIDDVDTIAPGSVELLGGVTVWTWVESMMNNDPAVYYSKGSDIMPTAAIVEYAV